MNKWLWLFLAVATMAGGYFFFTSKSDSKAPSSVAPPEEFVPPAEGTAPQNIPAQDAPLLPSKPAQQENTPLPPATNDHPGTTTPVVPTPANPNDFAPLDNSQFPPPEYPPQQDNFDPSTIPPPVFPEPVQGGDTGDDYIQPPITDED